MGKILRNSANVHDQDTGELVGYVNPITGQEVAAPALTAEAAAAVEALGVYDQAFVIGGQSNADGRGAIDANAEKPHPSCLLLTKGGKWEVCAEPAAKQDAGWINNIPSGGSVATPAHSFATSAAKSIFRLTGVRPAMVPCAIGSTGFTQWLPPSAEKDMTSLFGALHARAEMTQVRGQPPVFVWYGFEANAGSTTWDLATGTIGVTYMASWRSIANEIRARFPGAWMIYCQLGAGPDASFATNHTRTGEAQRRAEAGTGNSTNVISFAPSTMPAISQFSSGTNATNTITFGVSGGYSFSMVGDGSTALLAALFSTTVGARVRVTVVVTGTGLWKAQGSTATIVSGQSAGTHVLEYVADGSGRLQFSRNAATNATNLTFVITSVEYAQYAIDDRAVMVVTHDLPRNASPDGLHLSAQGQRLLGERIGKAYAQRILGDTAINGTGPRLVSCTKSGAVVTVKFDRTIKTDANGYGAELATSLFRVYLAGVEQTLNACARAAGDDTAVEIACAASVASGVCVVTYGDRAGPSGEAWRPGVVYDLDGMPAPMMGPVIAV